MTDSRAYVRYNPAIEHVPDGEGEAIAGIIASMTHESEITSGRYKHAVRASHRRATVS